MKPLNNPKPLIQNALNPWHAVKPAYACACLSIAVFEKSPLCLFVQCIGQTSIGREYLRYVIRNYIRIALKFHKKFAAKLLKVGFEK